MATIKLSKSIGGTNYEITLFSTNVEEQIDKNVANWSEYIPPAGWTTKAALRNTMDSKSILNTFNVTGRISLESLTGTATNAPYVRDLLRAFAYTGGPCKFFYGVASDLTGLTYTTVNFAPSTNTGLFYTNTGFNVHITRLQVIEDAKGGDSGKQITTYGSNAEKEVPESYSVQITLMISDEISQ